MFDVEFLLQKPKLTQPLVYVYRSGGLRHAVRKVFFNEMNERTPAGIVPVDKLAFHLMSDGIIPSPVFCEWSTRDKIDADSTRDVLNSLAGCEGARVALFLSERHRVTQHPLWDRVCSNALVLTEPDVTQATLPLIIRFLEKNEGLDLAGHQVNARFLAGFDDLIDQENATILDVKWRYVELALASSADSKRSKAELHEAKLKDRRAERATTTELKKFLDSPTELTLRPLVQQIEGRWLREGSGQAVVTKVIRWTKRALDDPFLSGGSRDIAWLLWACLLIAHEGN